MMTGQEMYEEWRKNALECNRAVGQAYWHELFEESRQAWDRLAAKMKAQKQCLGRMALEREIRDERSAHARLDEKYAELERKAHEAMTKGIKENGYTLIEDTKNACN